MQRTVRFSADGPNPLFPTNGDTLQTETVTAKKPKNQNEDCSMVATITPVELSKVETILFEAVRRRRHDLLSQIIDGRKCDLNVRDSYDRTPLHLAASDGDFTAVKLLVKGRANIDPCDKFGISPLFWAVYNSHKHVACYLVDEGAKYNRVTKQGFTIMHFIAESNAIAFLKYLHHKFQLLKYDEVDNNGMTPFLVAASKGNRVLMEVLVHKHCNALAMDKQNRNAIHLAAKNGHMDVVRYLIKIPQLHSKLDDLDSRGCSAVHLACASNQQEVLRLLLLAGADPNIVSDTQSCPLIECSRRGFHRCMDILLYHGADKNKRNKNGETALHTATLANLTDTVYFLASRELDLEATNNRMQTPLHAGVEQHKLDTVEALLFCGARLNAVDKDNHTPLMIAARANYTALVDMLIRADRWRTTNPIQAEEFHEKIMAIPKPNLHDSIAEGDLLNEMEQEDISNILTASVAESRHGRSATLSQVSSGQHTIEQTSRQEDYAYDADNYDNVEHEDDDDSEDNTVVDNRPSPNQASLQDNPEQQTNRMLTDSENFSLYDTNTDEEFVDPFRDMSFTNVDEDFTRNSVATADGSDDLSLGFEASRIWQRNQLVNAQDQILIYPDQSDHPNHVDNAAPDPNNAFVPNSALPDTRPSTQQPANGWRQTIPGSQVMLPNGEVLFVVNDDSAADPNSMQINNSTLNVQRKPEAFTLKTPCQPYAEEAKVLLYELSHKYLKHNDWKKMAQYWGFSNDDISAIELQDVGKRSYKEHGYRMLAIWLHGVPDNVSPFNELNAALVAIGRPQVAHSMRKRIEASNSAGAKHSKCKVS